MENRYDKYKDSGIAWIGEIPEHWEVIKIKYLAKIKSGDSISSNEMIQEGIYEVYGGNGLIGYCNKKNVNDFNIIIGRVGALCGNVRLISESKFITDNALILNCFDNTLYPYMYIMLKAANLNNLNTSNAQPLITGSKVLNVSLPIPPLSEKQSIATYLNQKCSEIDELITLQEEMITKLQSYKQSVITEAVTKGLDKNVPLKDSGIEWIGEIPEHWNIIKTKNAFKIISGATPKTDNITYWDGEIIWITPADYKTEDRIIKSGKRNITLAGLNSCGTSIIPENSIIFSKRAPIGLVAINIVPLCTNQGCISCIPKSFVSSKYFYYLMSVLTEWFELFGSGTTFKELSTNNFANFSLSQPPFSEQQSIADYLDQKCSEIDELITIKQQKIEKLKDYKKSLIFECVTGKRKVS